MGDSSEDNSNQRCHLSEYPNLITLQYPQRANEDEDEEIMEDESGISCWQGLGLDEWRWASCYMGSENKSQYIAWNMSKTKKPTKKTSLGHSEGLSFIVVKDLYRAIGSLGRNLVTVPFVVHARIVSDEALASPLDLTEGREPGRYIG